MDSWVIELIRQVPSAAAVIGTVFLFLKWMAQSEERRDANAKDRAVQDRAHQIEINTLWANTIKEAFDRQDETAVKTTQMIVDKLANMDKAAEERYRKMNITQELIDAVKLQTKKQSKESTDG